MLILLLVAALAACSSSARGSTSTVTSTVAGAPTVGDPATTVPKTTPTTEPRNIYAADGPNMLSPVVKNFPTRIYVPNSLSNTVDEIDPATGAITKHFAVGRLPQHVVPSWDLKTLYVTNDLGNSLTPIDPRTGEPGPTIPVDDPYNMYFTPDGKYSIVVAERFRRLDFRDPHTFQLIKPLQTPCKGVDHMDFSADGSYLIASCEFSGQVIKVDLKTLSVVGVMALRGGNAKPQDVKVDPTGRRFYVADMIRGGVYVIDAASFTVSDFIPTGRGAHGLYVSRDARTMFITNRDAGSVSLLDFSTDHVVATWVMPGGGSPDMGGVSADGKTLWVSGRYNSRVYAFDVATGALVKSIVVGSGPHGLAVYPQPGRYSMGHTGVFR
jgi:DNA-binding beta-propeller fold protein YncE